MSLIEGKTYKVVYPNNMFTVAKLVEVKNYPATGMPSDYMFWYLSGEEGLAKLSATYPIFPLPEVILPQIRFVEVED